MISSKTIPLGQMIRDYRESNKISIREFASSAGVSKSYIALLESSRHNRMDKQPDPSTEVLLGIAEAMKMSPERLFKKLGYDIGNSSKTNSRNSSRTKIQPFTYIPPTVENLRSALAENRILILPFSAPTRNSLVYIPQFEEDGMVITHTVSDVSGGVYTAFSELLGSVTFTLYDINRTVFIKRSDAYDALKAWLSARSDKYGRFQEAPER